MILPIIVSHRILTLNNLIMKILKKILILIYIIGSSTFSYAQDLTEIYAKVNPAVVVIYTEEKELKNTGSIRQTVTSQGLGSGFMISDKQIVTAAHIVDVAEKLTVQFLDGEKIPTKVVSANKTTDVALIELIWSKKNATIVNLGNSDQFQIGEQIFIVGAPFGLGHSLSSGYVSGFKKSNGNNIFTKSEFIQTDTAINTGNSGGPMFNLKGEVIGIVSKILSKSGGFEGIGFAATSNIAKSLLMDEKIPWMGADMIPITGKTARIFNIPQKSGLLVQRVVPTSKFGIKGIKGGDTEVLIENQKLIAGGDIILSINDIEFDVTDQALTKLGTFVTNLKEGDSFELKILRNGKIIILKF